MKQRALWWTQARKMALVIEGVEYGIAWAPQPGPQTLLLRCPASQPHLGCPPEQRNHPAFRGVVEIFFGGARGGGKTSGVLGKWTRHANRWGRRAKGILFRHTYDELEEVQEQAKAVYDKLGAHYHNGKRMWVFPNEATIKFRYMEQDKHADHYQGHAYTFQAWEEITNWATPVGIDKVSATLRSSQGVECEWVGTGNPGGRGHNWVKARFVDPSAPFRPFFDPVTKKWRVFIPSKLADNKILMRNDPGYADRLKGAGPEWLVKAWLEGLWNIVAGGMFDDIWDDTVHVIAPFRVPKNWVVERAFDWGSSAPFSLGWWATANGESVEDERGNKLYFAKGTKIRIGEWYGWNGEPNKGLNMVDTDIARQAVQLEKAMEKANGYHISEGPADPSIFNITNGHSIASAMSNVGLHFLPASTGPGSRVAGWEGMRRMLKASCQSPMPEAGMFAFNTCRQFIRTVPALPRDTKKIDDVDTDSEDHVGDETRYAITHQRREVFMVKMGA